MIAWKWAFFAMGLFFLWSSYLIKDLFYINLLYIDATWNHFFPVNWFITMQNSSIFSFLSYRLLNIQHLFKYLIWTFTFHLWSPFLNTVILWLLYNNFKNYSCQFWKCWYLRILVKELLPNRYRERNLVLYIFGPPPYHL